MWSKMIWGLSALTVVLLIGFSMLIIPAQKELKQILEEAKAVEKRYQVGGKHDHGHAGIRTHAGISDLEQGTETVVEPNDPVNVNESGNMTETTETAAVGMGANGEVFRYKDGIYKGLTYPEAVKFWRKRVDKASQERREVNDLYYNMEEALMNASHSGVAILFAGLRKLPSDVYEKAMDQVFENKPNDREKFDAYMNEVEKHSYSGSLEDQISMFENEKDYRQMLRISLDELRPERDRLHAEFRMILKENPPRR